jgi:hypothetical protein
MTALVIFATAFLVTLACLYYMAEDQQDETINVDQFRRERAAVIAQIQADTKARVIQRKEGAR